MTSENFEKPLSEWLAPHRITEIDQWIAKYPKEQRQSAVMRALMLAQEEHHYLTPPLMKAVADYLNMPEIAVYEVASFYSMYHTKPAGKHIINVCRSISCKLCDSDKVTGCIAKQLGIAPGETTKDGRFTLREVECLGACVGAPMMQVDKEYYEHLTPEKIEKILEGYK